MLDVQLRVYGPQHPEVLVTETTLAHTISEEGRYAEADKIQGFEVESVKEVAGLGLISMRERLRLIGGHLSIESDSITGANPCSYPARRNHCTYRYRGVGRTLLLRTEHKVGSAV